MLLLILKLSQRLTLRLKVLAGVTLSRQPQKSCPHLGSANDPFNHGPSAADDHRCYLYMQRDRIDLLHQKSFCLSTAHHNCPWLMIRRPDAPPPLKQRLPGLVGAFPRAAVGALAACMRRTPSLAGAAGRRLAPAAAGTVRAFATAMRATGHLLMSLGSLIDRGVGFVAQAIANVVKDVIGSGFAARALLGLLAALWFVIRAPFRVGASLAMAIAHAGRAAAGRRQARRAEQAAMSAPELQPMAAAQEPEPVETAPSQQPAILPVYLQELLTDAFPELDTTAAAAQAPAAPSFTAHVDEVEVISERLKAPLARFEELVARLDELVSEGVSALDRGQDNLAYELFLKATQQPANMVDKAADPALRNQHTSLMTRAWFWRAKTAETVEEVVQTLEEALRYDPNNLQIEAHLAWARQRLEREQRLERVDEMPLKPVVAGPGEPSRRSRVLGSLGEAIRLVGGIAALALAALWMTTALLPALTRVLANLPPADQALVQRFVLTLNAAALPGQGHLPLPMLHYDLGLSLPFVMAFSFVFTARGLMDGDGWARTTGLLLAGVGGWLCAAAVTNPDASRLGLALCVGIIIAAVVGRFDAPKVMPRASAGY